MNISIIAAMDQKRGIGKNNKIPWHIKEDLVKLRNLTKDRVVILGRKTYDSMLWYYNKSGKQMPGRLYIVITHDKDYKTTRDNATVAHSLEEALDTARKDKHLLSVIAILSKSLEKQSQNNGIATSPRSVDMNVAPRNDNNKEVFIIGGGQIYQQALPFTDKLYLTIVEGNYNCDTFFPDYSEFRKVISQEPKESEGYKYKFLELEK